jgi:hypothetical protein
MSGGGFNRIIGFSRVIGGQERIQYVLRGPRFEAAQLDHEVAVLQFLRQYSNLPVPEGIKFNEMGNNLLRSPYMVQTRIPGIDLYSCFPKLDHMGKCMVAQQLGHVFRQMLSLQSQATGVLVFSPDNKSLRAPLWVMPFTRTETPLLSYSNAPPGQSTCSMLTTIFQDRKTAALKQCSTDFIRSELMDQFVTMTAELDTNGWLGNNKNSLYHPDLAPRNILVDHASDAPLSKISGILDWDSAIFGPSFMSCAPPLWIWAWNDYEDEDERTANDDPLTPELRRLKHIFEEAAGPNYVQLAYKAPYRLARRLVHYAIHDIRSKEDVDEANAMLQEWVEMRQSQLKA